MMYCFILTRAGTQPFIIIIILLLFYIIIVVVITSLFNISSMFDPLLFKLLIVYNFFFLKVCISGISRNGLW